MAGLFLRRGQQQSAALEAARQAEAADRADKAGPGKLGKEDHDVNLSESLAVLAWALAKNGGSSGEVESALKEAFDICPETTKPIRAEIHFFAGHAYAELGNSSSAGRR